MPDEGEHADSAAKAPKKMRGDTSKDKKKRRKKKRKISVVLTVPEPETVPPGSKSEEDATFSAQTPLASPSEMPPTGTDNADIPIENTSETNVVEGATPGTVSHPAGLFLSRLSHRPCL